MRRDSNAFGVRWLASAFEGGGKPPHSEGQSPLASGASVSSANVRALLAILDARSALATRLARALIDLEARALAGTSLQNRATFLHDPLERCIIERLNARERIDAADVQHF